MTLVECDCGHIYFVEDSIRLVDTKCKKCGNTSGRLYKILSTGLFSMRYGVVKHND